MQEDQSLDSNPSVYTVAGGGEVMLGRTPEVT